MSRLDPIIEGLDRVNAPVKLKLTTDDLFKATADIYWIAHGGPDLHVGTVEAVGITSGSPSGFKLTTDRIAYNNRGRATREWFVSYKHAKSCVAGIVKFSIPLKPHEQHDMKVATLRLNMETAQDALYAPYGRCCNLIGVHSVDVIDFLLYGRRSAKLENLVQELAAWEANYQGARKAYEDALSEKLPAKVY